MFVFTFVKYSGGDYINYESFFLILLFYILYFINLLLASNINKTSSKVSVILLFSVLVLYSQRFVALSIPDIKVRYDGIMTSENILDAVIFLDLALLVLLLYQLVNYNNHSKCKFYIERIFYSKSIRYTFYKFVNIILMLGIVQRIFFYNNDLAQAWVSSIALKIPLYLLAYSFIFVNMTLILFINSKDLRIDNSEKKHIYFVIALYVIHTFSSASKGAFIAIAISFVILMILNGKSFISKRGIKWITAAGFLTLFMMTGQGIIHSILNSDLSVSNRLAAQESIINYEGKGVLSFAQVNVENFSRRLGGVDWVSLMYSEHRDEIGREFDISNVLSRISNRFSFSEDKFSVINNGKVIPCKVRDQHDCLSLSYGEYPTLFGVISLNNLLVSMLLIMLFLGLIHFVVIAKYSYLLKGNLVLLLSYNFFVSGDTPELLKSSFIIIFFFYVVVSFAKSVTRKIV